MFLLAHNVNITSGMLAFEASVLQFHHRVADYRKHRHVNEHLQCAEWGEQAMGMITKLKHTAGQ